MDDTLQALIDWGKFNEVNWKIGSGATGKFHIEMWRYNDGETVANVCENTASEAFHAAISQARGRTGNTLLRG